MFAEVPENPARSHYGGVTPTGLASSYKLDESHCIRCGDAIGPVLVTDDNGHDHPGWIPLWEDPLRQGYCEDCCLDLEYDQ